jgi:hypothetical protein
VSIDLRNVPGGTLGRFGGVAEQVGEDEVLDPVTMSHLASAPGPTLRAQQ